MTQSVVRAIESISAEFTGVHGHDRVPAGRGKNDAYAEFAGPHGPVGHGRSDPRVVLFGPKCTYPAHAYDGLTESC